MNRKATTLWKVGCAEKWIIWDSLQQAPPAEDQQEHPANTKITAQWELQSSSARGIRHIEFMAFRPWFYSLSKLNFKKFPYFFFFYFFEFFLFPILTNILSIPFKKSFSIFIFTMILYLFIVFNLIFCSYVYILYNFLYVYKF